MLIAVEWFASAHFSNFSTTSSIVLKSRISQDGPSTINRRRWRPQVHMMNVVEGQFVRTLDCSERKR